jgi:hypothetical protein
MATEKLTPYRPGVRPPTPTSLPQFLDAELKKIQLVSSALVEAAQALEALYAALDERVASLEAP